MPVQIRQTDSADRLPPHSSTGMASPFDRPPSLGWREILARYIGGAIALCILFGLVYLAFGRQIRDWLDFGWGSTFVGLLPWLALAGAVLWFWDARHNRRVIEQPGGVKLFADQVRQADGAELMRGIVAVQYGYATTPGHLLAQQTYSPTIQQAKELPALVAPQEMIAGPALLPPHEWLPWFDRRPHGLLAAETGGGKSTTFKAILKSRIERGELVFLLDPHSSDWFGLPGIGGGEDWEAVWSGMRVVISEYRTRLQARDAYLRQHHAEMPVDAFKRITILLDEANTACKELNVARRGETSRWAQFAQTLGSGARKVNLSIILLAQSPNVEDLDMSGPMRNNFTRIALDARTTRMMVQAEETDATRKKDLLASLVGQEYPATAIRNGQVVLLDRTGLDMVGTPHNPDAALWTEGYEQAERLIGGRVLPPQPVVARPAVALRQTQDETARASVAVDPLDIYRGMTFTDDVARIGWLAANTTKGTREIRDIVGCHYPTVVAVARVVRSHKNTGKA